MGSTTQVDGCVSNTTVAKLQRFKLLGSVPKPASRSALSELISKLC